jgi:hypothetical protein
VLLVVVFVGPTTIKENQMSNPAQTAINFTIAGIEGLIRHNERDLAEIDELDEIYRDQGREARAAARPLIEAKVAAAREALRIRREAGGS